MRIIRDPYQKLNIKTVVALGCFDGVHKAHARVIGEAVRLSRDNDCAAMVWCFTEPPKNTFLKVPAPLICDSTEKARLIRMLGVNVLTEVDFTPEIAGMSARDFVEKLLCECAGAVHLVCGNNYTFGVRGEGNIDVLRQLCREFKLGLSVVDDVTLDGVNISSSIVREAVTSGQCVYARSLLGRNFSLCFGGKAEDADILGSDQTKLVIDKKYLCVPAGEYGVTVYFGGYKKECVALIREGERGRELLLNTYVDATARVRVEFRTNKG